MKSIRLGQLTIDPPLISAPMAGVTTKSLRRLIHELNPGACGLYYTEFASIEGLVRRNKPTLRLIEKSNVDCETPFAIQLFGMDPVNMAESAKIAVEYGADVVDINAGCPAQKVVKKGGGADLLKRPQLIGEIVKSVKAAVSVPVAVKIRVGWDEGSINVFEVTKIIEDNGADLITIHGRTRNQAFTGEANWDLIREAKQRLKIPVVGNGDVVDTHSLDKRFAPSGVDGIMIGRGMLKDPWIFSRLKAHIDGAVFNEPSPEERYKLFERFHVIMKEDDFPEGAALGMLKQMAVRYLRAKPNSVQYRTAALRSVDFSQFFEAVRNYLFWNL
ncbi:MAG: tRNA-dihydrouridine synthase [Fibrobacteres bacterium]|nr:tRNA-dihydrouridine synthase [Fibrobacterota bacterium]